MPYEGANQADQQTYTGVNAAEHVKTNASCGRNHVQTFNSQTSAAPNNVQHLFPQESVGRSSVQAATNADPTAPRPTAWAVPQATDQRPQLRHQANRHAHSQHAELPPETGSYSHTHDLRGYEEDSPTSLIPAQNSRQDWPTAEQAQRQPQQGNKVTYGSTAGSSQWGRPGGKNAGKQVMASRGFCAPIQITRVDWGEPLANAQDTWGEEEVEPQPLPSAMPAAGVPSARRTVRTAAAFPPVADNDSSAEMTGTPDSQQSARRTIKPPPPAAMHWQRMWTTDSLDHTGDDVRACLHVATMPDLVDESGGAGEHVDARNFVCLHAWKFDTCAAVMSALKLQAAPSMFKQSWLSTHEGRHVCRYLLVLERPPLMQAG